jgi:glycerol-3-phosphate O-acyltransferase/dihydroxyacetone phosphate acyltransferase
VTVLYGLIRAVLGVLLRCFYRIERAGPAVLPDGPLLLVGNHPNALVDPALLIALCPRPLTLLAKAPLFRIPVLGWLVRALGALPVVRLQDGPSSHEMARNAEALEAAARGLASGRAVALFPEGRSHSEPALGALKTGAARLALQASVPVQIVPVGLTYADKQRFRSGVRIEFGPPLRVSSTGHQPEDVRALTARIAEALGGVTLNLPRWEDLPLLQAAEDLYALATAAPARDPERQRLFARGLSLLRLEQPERAAALQAEVLAFQRRLALTRAEATDLGIEYRPGQVARFVLRNLTAVVLGLPLAALGMVVFGPVALATRAALRLVRADADMVATLKLVAALLLGPLYVAALAAVVWKFFGGGWALLWIVGALPLAFFTRRFLARRAEAFADARLFFRFGNTSERKRHLREEADALARRLTEVVEELRPRLTGSPAED